MFYLFPFNKVDKGCSIILYGAGEVAKCYIQQIQSIDYCNVLFAVDRNYQKIDNVQRVSVYPPDTILTTEYDLIVIAVSKNHYNSVWQDICEMNIDAAKMVYGGSVLPSYTHANSYSQHGEDLVVLSIFQTLGIGKPSYVDVGAFHPHSISNTALLYKFGSRGINIEANPDFMKAFNEERPDDININIGIGAKQGILPFYRVGDSICTFSYNLALHWINMHPDQHLKIEEIMEIQVTTLDEVIKQYANGEYPDFMDIDLEGLDYEVLESCNFSKGKPLVLCVELTDKRTNKMLAEKRFIPYCKMGCNMIYIHETIKDQIFGSGK